MANPATVPFTTRPPAGKSFAKLKSHIQLGPMLTLIIEAKRVVPSRHCSHCVKLEG